MKIRNIFLLLFFTFFCCKNTLQQEPSKPIEKHKEKEDNDKVEIVLKNTKLVMIKIKALNVPTLLCQEPNVTLSSYQIAQTETTQELYEKIMKINPTQTPIAEGNVPSLCPVSEVRWYNAIAFCNELTITVDNSDKNCVYFTDKDFKKAYRKEDAVYYRYPYIKWQAKGFRLPTEAEWEWAALGGEDRKYPGSDDAKDVAWFDDKYLEFAELHNVATKKPNAYGLYDMAGNVAEWVWDPYVEEDQKKETGAMLDPFWLHIKDDRTGSCKGLITMRGGDYTACKRSDTKAFECKARDEGIASNTYLSREGFAMGFRIARHNY